MKTHRTWRWVWMALLLLLSLAAGCSPKVVRETVVIEKVVKEQVVEKEVAKEVKGARAAAPAERRGCPRRPEHRIASGRGQPRLRQAAPCWPTRWGG